MRPVLASLFDEIDTMFSTPALIFLYVSMSFLVAFLGIPGKLGYFWTFIFSLLLTPLTILLSHIISRKLATRRLTRAHALIAKHEQLLNQNG